MKSSLGWTLIGIAIWFVFLALIRLASGWLLDLALVIALMVILAGICAKMTEGTRHKEYQSLIAFWSEFAKETGLVLDGGNEPHIFRLTHEPGVNGIYHGHRVFASRTTSGSDNESFKVYTCVSLEVQNTNGYQLVVQRRPFLERTFSFDNTRSRNADCDRLIKFDGYPDCFLQKARQCIARLPGFLDGPDAFAPSIQLQGSQLLYLEPGGPTAIEDKSQILNLLCDLAELTEEADSE